MSIGSAQRPLIGVTGYTTQASLVKHISTHYRDQLQNPILDDIVERVRRDYRWKKDGCFSTSRRKRIENAVFMALATQNNSGESRRKLVAIAQESKIRHEQKKFINDLLFKANGWNQIIDAIRKNRCLVRSITHNRSLNSVYRHLLSLKGKENWDDKMLQYIAGLLCNNMNWCEGRGIELRELYQKVPELKNCPAIIRHIRKTRQSQNLRELGKEPVQAGRLHDKLFDSK